MNVVKVSNTEELYKKAAFVIAAQMIQKPDSVLGFATGSTPEGIYRELCSMYQGGLLDFSQIMSFNLDEYYGLSANDLQSFRYYMNQQLFNHVNIRPEQTHVPDGSVADPQAECSRYEAAIDAAGGVDLQLLGIGRNGHIGFNEPDDSFADQTQIVKLTEDTLAANQRFFDSPDQMPTQAISMGIGTIMKADQILLVAFGPDKHEAISNLINGPITPKVPASILRFHKRVTVIYCD